MSESASVALECPACRFGRFELQPSQRRLLVDGQPATLGARAFDILLVLVARAGQLVSKHDLLTLVWPGLVVEENNLQVQISTLRKVLGPQAIATIPGRGYRFSAPLEATDVDSGAAVSGAFVASSKGIASAAQATNLPADLPKLYGRAADLQALGALMETHKLVTIVGSGGIGKSRLAQAAAHSLAHRWPDGAWMVELAGLSDPKLLPHTVAQALNVKMTGKESAHDDLARALAQQSLLLVLDNCEHLLEAAAALAQAILARAPNIALLTTSQEPLRLPAEQQYRVVPLAVPPGTAGDAREFGAVALFEARVQAVDPRFALNDESLPLVIDICRRLDGLPLAIELAAARAATLGLRPLRDKLDARFKLLSGGARATLRRHQTLRAALEWSHNLLNEDEKVVFRRLGAFAGGFTMELAQFVAGDARLDEWAVLDILSALVEKSLVVADAGELPRYRLLESARAFALEQLATGEMTEILRQHALAMRNYMERIDGAHLDGELRTDALKALMMPELDNLRAAYTWASAEANDVATAITLAAGLSSLEEFIVESADWLLPLQGKVDVADVGSAVAARYWRAMASANMSGHVTCALQVQAAEEAQALYRELGQPRRAFSSLTQLAHRRLALRQSLGAQAAADAARNLVRPEWPAALRVRLLRVDCHIARDAGRFDEALALHHEVVRVSTSTGDWLLELMARGGLARTLWQTGRMEEAVREASNLADEVLARPVAAADEAWLLSILMCIQVEMGRIEEASAVGRRALPLMRRAKTYEVQAWAPLFWRRGQPYAAALLLGACDAERAWAGEPLPDNELRLIAKARAGLEAELSSDTLASHLAAGARLSEGELFALISDGLAPAQVA